ncbi:glycerol-3-phosphate dehydrogenase/oxidase [Sinimarinibacterium sp. CAU 1509]|uniref:glycerol-3-phosphate dehydrogenase/oxidase n=1 Tax=Sinimarinibacterium sp. CAU 1509 TaxID=2562283 RepID=UPI0010AD7C94|nr:glycerol-3-phosphate dehydrogenase/oxidase [Sinimarinibacterium sp. CAU 1509]TJY62183.1 glycerol-3-phosphate dehydrogenase/oxidase [Sinimarinibacterium sp. CAU 1509]
MSSRIELSHLRDHYDLVIIGGGITGAGILREASGRGTSVLLVEARDFASGTSSWSSKLVHGGLRYLKNGQWRLTLESVRERQRLMREAPGLIDPQPFLMPIYAGAKPGRWLMQMGLLIYDLMGGVRRSSWLDQNAALKRVPALAPDRLLGAVAYEDARTDDARLVLRLIFEGRAAGADVLNYTRAQLRSEGGRVSGVQLIDSLSGQQREIGAGVVINATGAWASDIPGAPAGAPKLRPLRGSHLVFPSARWPLTEAVGWLHPRDQRPVFAYPWEGAVLYGTTDLDHLGTPDQAVINPAEVDYLIEALDRQFPALRLRASDALASYSGVRPIVDGGKADPSAESRESAMWQQPGLVGITGGKLTTFRVTARQVLREAAKQLPQLDPGPERPVFQQPDNPVDTHHGRRLQGRFGALAARLQAETPADELQPIGSTPYTWAELRWSARHEAVVCLSDLMMRRTRLGLVCADGGSSYLPRILQICAEELGWDEARCAAESDAYRQYWRRQHAPPGI